MGLTLEAGVPVGAVVSGEAVISIWVAQLGVTPWVVRASGA